MSRDQAIEPGNGLWTGGIVAHSELMHEVLGKVRKVARVSVTVLLTGESGVGKEVIARAIHDLGSRRTQPFIKLNCGAIPEKLLESELFGYERGAFTGANLKGKLGYFRMANHGVLFLDEIGELPLSLQVKLLRVLQESEVTPVGGDHPYRVNVQIVAATNADLPRMVATGGFRKDLYYRLNVIPIHIPPLRERPEDIPHLARHFLADCNERFGRHVHLSIGAYGRLRMHRWSGNVRELEHVVERIVVTSDRDRVDAAEVEAYLTEDLPSEQLPVVPGIIPLRTAVESVEEQLVVMAMRIYGKAHLAAKALEVSAPTFSRKYRAIQARQAENESARREHADEDSAKEVLVQELEKQLRIVAVVAAESLSVHALGQLKRAPTKDNPVYEQLRRQLTSLREREGTVQWTYVWHLDEQGQVVHLVGDSELDLAIGESYEGPPSMMSAVRRAFSGECTVSPIYRDRFGEWMSCLAPIRDETGRVIAVLGSDYAASYIRTELRELRQLLIGYALRKP